MARPARTPSRGQRRLLLVAAASGSVIGPAIAGPLVESAGTQTAFLILALPSLAMALAFAIRA